jgi:hypothetical protein
MPRAVLSAAPAVTDLPTKTIRIKALAVVSAAADTVGIGVA